MVQSAAGFQRKEQIICEDKSEKTEWKNPNMRMSRILLAEQFTPPLSLHFSLLTLILLSLPNRN